ncbi:MAG: hypothetical protein ACOYYJ_01485, partial [Chloroflexota bacterium]
IVCNADMRVGEVNQFCKLQEEGQRLMRSAMSQLNLSARAYHRTRSVKLSRTIADLAEALHVSQSSEEDAVIEWRCCAQFRVELSARYARLYGLTRDELRYTLRVDPKEVHG